MAGSQRPGSGGQLVADVSNVLMAQLADRLDDVLFSCFAVRWQILGRSSGDEDVTLGGMEILILTLSFLR